jgi:ADP-ribose pyrophosphatase YjhB (NUDIX family)
MPMSDYIRSLREKIGTTVLEVPTVSVLTFDDRARVLLVRHAEGNDWTTPGGMIEPYETPSDAAVREMWEETGLHVALTRVIGVFGGRLCASTYGNGDRVSWVSTVFAADVIGGALQPDGVETLETRYFARAELASIRCKPHVQLFLDAGFANERSARFQRPTWRPPAG